MKITELKEKLQSKNIQVSETWLRNQFPAQPSERYSKLTFMNFQNIEDNFGKEAKEELEEFLKKPRIIPINVVILAELTKNGKAKKKPRLFAGSEALYYGQYELFACSAHMEGFVEIFQNVR
jgi:hypothetical protein